MFIGPILSGIMVSYYDFRAATAIAFVLFCLMVLLNFSTASTGETNKNANGHGTIIREDSGTGTPIEDKDKSLMLIN